jgi:hypothetical protein
MTARDAEASASVEHGRRMVLRKPHTGIVIPSFTLPDMCGDPCWRREASAPRPYSRATEWTTREGAVEAFPPTSLGANR